jgi:hypothetical protein
MCEVKLDLRPCAANLTASSWTNSSAAMVLYRASIPSADHAKKQNT